MSPSKQPIHPPVSDPDVEHRQIIAQLLRMLRLEIGANLRPELKGAYSLYVAEVMEQMLGHMADWLTGGLDMNTAEARAALLGAAGEACTAANRFLPDFDDETGIDEALANAITTAARNGDNSTLARLGTGAAAANDELYQAQNIRHAKAVTDEIAYLAKMDWEVTPALFDRYAVAKLGIIDPVGNIVKIPGGHSKDTFLVTLASGKEVIIRRDFPFGPVDNSAPDEFSLLSNLFNHGFAVARPIAAEYEKEWLGQPFLVLEKVEGGDAHIAGMEDKALGKHVSLELARILAKLHALDVSKAGLSVSPGNASAQVAAYLASWRSWWEKHRPHPSSLIETGFVWLERNIPADIARTVVVHGDARPGNMLCKNGEVTALLDWEFAHPGDPAEDMLYAKGFVEPFVGWDEFLQTYLEAGGQPISEAGIRYYEVFRSLRNVVCCDVSWAGFIRRDYPVLKLAAQGVVYKRVLAQHLAASLRQVAW